MQASLCVNHTPSARLKSASRLSDRRVEFRNGTASAPHVTPTRGGLAYAASRGALGFYVTNSRERAPPSPRLTFFRAARSFIAPVRLLKFGNSTVLLRSGARSRGSVYFNMQTCVIEIQGTIAPAFSPKNTRRAELKVPFIAEQSIHHLLKGVSIFE